MFSLPVPAKMNAREILIIDDEREVCILLQNHLSRQNKKVSFATTLSEGVEKFKELNPGLLILDHNLPDGNGIDHIQKFKNLNPKVSIIIISALSHLKNEALAKGADHFLEKPISFSMLNSIIK
jgi:DNA-binding response OmpR family regulator